MRTIPWVRHAALMQSILLLLSAPPGVAAERAEVGEADLIVHNGKIVTMDDKTTSAAPGATVGAMAVKRGRIVALGGDEVMALRGARTEVIDLKGRTVIPGIIDTHSHAHEYAVDNHGSQLLDVFPELKVASVPGSAAAEVLDNLKGILSKRVSESQPGKWILLTIGNSKAGLAIYNDGRLSRAFLDGIAPRNPVHVRIRTSHVVNTPGWDAIEQLYGQGVRLHPEAKFDLGQMPHTPFGRGIPTANIMGTSPVALKAVMGLIAQELKEDASYGVTTLSSSLTDVLALNAYQALNRTGQLPIRVAWGHSTQPVNPLFYKGMGDIMNTEPTMLWNDGVSLGSVDKAYPRICSTASGLEKLGAICFLNQGSVMRDVLYQMIYRGQRFSNTHVAGDLALDQFLEILEKASRDAGLSEDDIRARRHTVDHCTLNPRPDQIPRLKKLGIVISCEPKYINDTSPRAVDTVGEKYLGWIVPAKSLIEAGVRLASGVDYHFTSSRSVFWLLDLLVNRRADDGQVYAPAERINRVWAMKTFTSWAADYVMKEKDIGSLETEKLADFVVLDRDYFDPGSVPDEEIDRIQVLMTVVGGQKVWVSPNF